MSWTSINSYEKNSRIWKFSRLYWVTSEFFFCSWTLNWRTLQRHFKLSSLCRHFPPLSLLFLENEPFFNKPFHLELKTDTEWGQNTQQKGWKMISGLEWASSSIFKHYWQCFSASLSQNFLSCLIINCLCRQMSDSPVESLFW